jgi:hypothetical protein
VNSAETIERVPFTPTATASCVSPVRRWRSTPLADVYRSTVEQLAAALAHEDDAQREAARQTLRGFIDRIVIPPGDGLLQVVGNLGEMLTTAAGGRIGSAAVGVANSGCGGSQPAVLAAVERGCVRAKLLRSLPS